ncbi:MAG: IPTL-CTERM sorting domain-containing protein [Xanthomonadales bacterium]|nr:IPTL-CTERM sorting domain-containing protein [Xanthomonadales bacterium]
MMKNICVFALLVFLGMSSESSAATGKDGNLTVTGNQVVNYFTGLTAVNTVGGVTLTVSDITDLNDVAGIYSSAALSTGDLIMLYQAQGASFTDTSDTSSYGAFDLGNAGRYEIYEVISVTGNDVVVADNGTLCNTNSLIYSYDLGLTQVIRVPQFDNLTIDAGGSIDTLAWNGSSGGVVAIDVGNTLTVNGTINASVAGFRGGVLDNLSAPGGTDITLYRDALAVSGAEKGEGILGFNSVYNSNGGSFGRGAPANGGGGGNSHNAGGGGGANGDNGTAWNGQGNPDNGPAGWTTAWNIDGTLTSATASSGGGRGGYTYGRNNQDALTVAPGTGTWRGNLRRERGGLGGRPLPFDDIGRLFFGGGGGAGDGNNGRAGAGGIGGGLIYIITNNLAGTGTISADGQVGFNTADNGGNNDAPGGGGAGGTIVISATSAAATVNLTANGGAGGDQLIIGNESEGPGGGGGGGVISISGGAGTPVASGGANGISLSAGVTEFLANGATVGGTGQPNEVTSPVVDLPVCRIVPALSTVKALTNNADEDGSLTTTENDTLTYTVTVTNTGNIALTNVVVTDPMITPTTNSCATVAVGATCVLIGTYVVTAGDVTTGSISNTGTGDSDETPPDNDILITPVVGTPALNTVKAMTGNADEDGSTSITENDTLTFTITVTNTGNIPLTNVVVTDPMITPTTNSCATVAVGATCVLVGTYMVTAADIVVGSISNTGTGDSDETPPSDDVLITPVEGSPALTIDKSLTTNADEDASSTVTINDTLTFTIIVTNAGDTTLTNVLVTDNMITPNANTCPSVAVGDTCVLIGTYVVQQSDIANGQIINVAEGLSDETATETDTATVVIGAALTAPISVPTLGQWGLIMLSLLMLLVAGRAFRQQQIALR